MPMRPQVGVGILIWRGEQLLLIKRKNVHGEGTWSSPGGHLEFGETPAACAVREALEETGVQVTDVQFRAVTNDIFVESGKHYITLWLEGQYAAGEPIVNASYEVAEVAWFPLNALPTPLFLPLENLLNGDCYTVKQ